MPTEEDLPSAHEQTDPGCSDCRGGASRLRKLEQQQQYVQPATTSAPAAATESTTTATASHSVSRANEDVLDGRRRRSPRTATSTRTGSCLCRASTGKLHAGDLLVSNFNDKANNQGTGTTIVQLTPAGKQSLFATINASALPGSCPGGVGLTTALSVLPGGYVVVGSLPTTNGKSATAQSGA